MQQLTAKLKEYNPISIRLQCKIFAGQKGFYVQISAVVFIEIESEKLSWASLGRTRRRNANTEEKKDGNNKKVQHIELEYQQKQFANAWTVTSSAANATAFDDRKFCERS